MNLTLTNYYYKSSSDALAFPQTYNLPFLQVMSTNNLISTLNYANTKQGNLITMNYFNNVSNSIIQHYFNDYLALNDTLYSYFL